MRCKPINVNEIVGGQVYIWVSVATSGRMDICYPIFCGQPRKCEVDGLVITRTLRTPWGRDAFISDMGLDPVNRYNYHRVFRFNLKNCEILRGLVTRQDLRGYLSLIGIDPESAMQQLQREYEEWREWDARWEKYWNAFPDYDDLSYPPEW